MYLLKIKCSSPFPVRSQGPKTQVWTLEQVESQEKDSELGQKVGKIWECSCAVWEDKSYKDNQLFESDTETLKKGAKADHC